MGKIIGSTVAGLGLVGVGFAGIAGQDDTTRDESGAIVEEGDLGAFRIRVGDCMGGGLEGLVESVDGVPCDGPHEYEVYYAFNVPEGDGAFPGDAVIEEASYEGCYDAFEPYVGASYEESIYGLNVLTPTEASWDELDDREVLCLIGNYDGSMKTGTAEGTGV